MKIATFMVGCALLCIIQLSTAKNDTSGSLAECKGHAVIFLDSSDCVRTLMACDVLNGPDCGNFDVTIAGTNSNVLDCTHAGKRVLVQLTPITGGAPIFCSIFVEDKTPPALICPDTFFQCDRNLDLLPYDSFGVEVHEACKLDTVIPILCGVTPGNCIDDTLKTLKVLWQAWDLNGNMSSCTQMIKLQRPELSDVVPPDDDTLYCEDFDLSLAAEPLLFDGTVIDGKCGLILSYMSIDTFDMPCGEKWITREWSVLDLCTLDTVGGTQMIAVLDTVAPLLDCPDDIERTLAATASGQFEYPLPQPQIIPHCDGDEGVRVSYRVNGSFYEAGGVALLEEGINSIICTATDACWKTSTCTYTVDVTPEVNVTAEAGLGQFGNPLTRQNQSRSFAYPNPVESTINLQLGSSIDVDSGVEVTFMDINGKLLKSVEQRSPSDRKLQFNGLDQLPPGIIQIAIVTARSSEILKLVKI